MPDITIGQAGIYAILGYSIVFIGLIALMLVITLLGKLFTQKKEEKAPVTVAEAAAPAPAAAPGTAGSLKLYNVDPKTAAMLMAIVANKMGKPINELRFLSIKEVSE
jgi:Na+-transporting methylmalonyl-CoA/oxaloacetate decarboxylase gamma subunit